MEPGNRKVWGTTAFWNNAIWFDPDPEIFLNILCLAKNRPSILPKESKEELLADLQYNYRVERYTAKLVTLRLSKLLWTIMISNFDLWPSLDEVEWGWFSSIKAALKLVKSFRAV